MRTGQRDICGTVQSMRRMVGFTVEIFGHGAMTKCALLKIGMFCTLAGNGDEMAVGAVREKSPRMVFVGFWLVTGAAGTVNHEGYCIVLYLVMPSGTSVNGLIGTCSQRNNQPHHGYIHIYIYRRASRRDCCPSAYPFFSFASKFGDYYSPKSAKYQGVGDGR